MVDGVAKFQRQFKNIPRQARRGALEAMRTGGKELVNGMKRRAPTGDTGNLRRSIKFEFGRGKSKAAGSIGIAVTAGDETTMVLGRNGRRWQNARLQEFGTRKMSPNPFFFVTYRQLKRRVKSRITRQIKAGIKKGARS